MIDDKVRICSRCPPERNVELYNAAQLLGGDIGIFRVFHEHAHLTVDLEQRERQLHELQCAGKAILVNWERNLTEYVQELAQYVPDVCVCPWCEGPILDIRATKESVCPHEGCGHNLIRLNNEYRCDDCNVEWEDEHSCAVDDDCPECGTATSPHTSEEIEE